ncbi:hypothetical protein GS888_26365 [Rhodococcus hoagii]|nr:hypothetical protein [Prescottella equi]
MGDALRRAALVELIKVDLEYRLLRADRPRSLASYCEEFPELRSKPLPPTSSTRTSTCAGAAGTPSTSRSTHGNSRSTPTG